MYKIITIETSIRKDFDGFFSSGNRTYYVVDSEKLTKNIAEQCRWLEENGYQIVSVTPITSSAEHTEKSYSDTHIPFSHAYTSAVVIIGKR